MQPWIPGEQAIHYLSAGLYNLAGQLNKGIAKLLKLHPQHRLLLRFMLLLPAALLTE